MGTGPLTEEDGGPFLEKTFLSDLCSLLLAQGGEDVREKRELALDAFHTWRSLMQPFCVAV